MTRRRLIGFIAVVVLTVGLSAFFVTRNTRQDVRAEGSSAPGFDDSERTADEGPFELAAPSTTAGPTTIPGSGRRSFETTTTTSTTTTTTTTSTTIPTRALTPSVESIRSVCGIVDTLQSASNVFYSSDADPKRTLTAISRAIMRYADVAPTEISEDATAISTMFDQLVEQVRAADWDVSNPGVVRSVEAMKNQVDPFATLQEHVRRIQFYEAIKCTTIALPPDDPSGIGAG